MNNSEIFITLLGVVAPITGLSGNLGKPNWRFSLDKMYINLFA